MTAPYAPTPPGLRHLTGWAFVTAPLWLLAAWVVMWPLDGRRGPGIGWTVAHASWLVGFVALALVCLELGRRTRTQSLTAQRIAGVSTAVTLLGLATGVAQMIVDLVAGFQASSHDAMQARADELTSYPGMHFVLYTLGPPLVFVGLFALFVVLASGRLASAADPVLVLLAFVVIGGFDELTPIGLVFLAVPLVPTGWRLIRS